MFSNRKNYYRHEHILINTMYVKHTKHKSKNLENIHFNHLWWLLITKSKKIQNLRYHDISWIRNKVQAWENL